MRMARYGIPAIAAGLLAGASIYAVAQDETDGELMPTLYAATLNGAAEVPPVETDARGIAEVFFDEEALTIRWEVSFEGLSGPATGAHIHGPAAEGSNAGVVIDLMAGHQVGDMAAEEGMMADDDMMAEDGGENVIEGSASITAEQATDLGGGLWYVNIHTDANPDGEIRGQLRLGVAELQ